MWKAKSPAVIDMVPVYDLRRCLMIIRRSTGWSVRQAAKKARITSSTFNRVENGAKMDAATWRALSDFIAKYWPRATPGQG